MSNEEFGIPEGASDLPPFPILGTEKDIGRQLGFGSGDGMSPAECEIIAYGIPEAKGKKTTCRFYKEVIEMDEAQDGPRKFMSLQIKVRSEEFGAVTLFEDQPIWEGSGSKLPEWLRRLGVDPKNHKAEDVLGKPCAVVVTVYQKNDGGLGNRLEDVLGVG